jgi:hypothetical protein
MKKTLRLLPLLACLFPLAVQAQQWNIGGGVGAFTFGDFSSRTVRIGNESGSASTTIKLSAKTRPGVTVDLGRDFSDSFGMRLQATWVDAPIAVKNGDGDGVALDDGKLDVTTLSVPFVWTINSRGSFRFHLLAGPAYAMYRLKRQGTTLRDEAFFNGTRNRFGVIGGAGVDWWWSRRFAVEGEISDILTSSPIERADYQGLRGVDIPRPHNVHTTVGLRYRF